MTAVLQDDAVPRARWRTPLLLCLAATASGFGLGAIANAIDGQVSRDYFAIVMSWDWEFASVAAVVQGAFEGTLLGLVFGVFISAVLAASTKMRCPLPLAMDGLKMALAFVASSWLIGGITGTVLARLVPNLWGFVFVGVPPRVNLPRFAWVGGSIWGAYFGAAVAFLVTPIYLHVTWRRTTRRVHGFPMVVAPPDAA